MAIHDWNGTNNTINKKIYDWNGTVNTQNKKVYDWDGTVNRLIYTSEEVLLGVGSVQHLWELSTRVSGQIKWLNNTVEYYCYDQGEAGDGYGVATTKNIYRGYSKIDFTYRVKMAAYYHITVEILDRDNRTLKSFPLENGQDQNGIDFTRTKTVDISEFSNRDIKIRLLGGKGNHWGEGRIWFNWLKIY